jgi:hypothetical protein
VSLHGRILRSVVEVSLQQHPKSITQRELAVRKEQERIWLADTGYQLLETTSPWIERTQWPTVVQGLRRDILVSFA